MNKKKIIIISIASVAMLALIAYSSISALLAVGQNNVKKVDSTTLETTMPQEQSPHYVDSKYGQTQN